MSEAYRLFGEFAHRYDLHTPPDHYRDDQAFVTEAALDVAPDSCRLLDVGCGTGVLLEKAIAAGIDAHGIDSASEMVAVARQRVEPHRVRVERMQDILAEGAYDVVCSLSWAIHYCRGREELEDVIQRCHRALRPAGRLILQVANDERMTGAVNVDREPGPSGEPDDTLFIHRFRAVHDGEHSAIIDYVYASKALGELLCEQHELRFANPLVIADTLRAAGFQEVHVVKCDSVSPFVVGRV